MKITLGGRALNFSALNWTQLTELQQDIAAATQVSDRAKIIGDKDTRDSVLRVVVASVQREQPEVDPDFVSKHLDLSNFSEILKSVFGLNGFKEEPTGEAKAATSEAST